MTSSVRADSMLDIVAICHDFHQVHLEKGVENKYINLQT